MGRPERPLDPTAGPLEAFAVGLRELRNAAGRESYRTLSDRAGFSPSVLSAATSGFSLPTLRVTLGLVAACGGDEAEWTGRWQAVADQVQVGEAVDDRPAARFRAAAPQRTITAGAQVPARAAPYLAYPARSRPVLSHPAQRGHTQRNPAQLAAAVSDPAVLSHLGTLPQMAPLPETVSLPQLAPLPRPAQLPVAPVCLAGRAREITHITALSNRERRNGRAPILISGAVGAGKSATAVHWCHRNAEQFPDGVLYADLGEEGTDAAHDILAAFLLALGTPAGQIPVKPAHRAALYRSLVAERRMLILLDNAGDEAQVRPLLATAPRSQVLITSRSRMAGLDGVERVALDPMSPEQSIALLGAIVGHDQVTAHRGRALEVAALCDHLPGALRTIGTRISVRRGWTLARAADRLRDERRRLGYLTAGPPGLREAFRTAHRGLDTDSRRMLMRVARSHQFEFDAGGPARAARVPLDEAEESLEALVDAGLLQPTATTGTYRLPVLFRLLSLEMLQSAPPVKVGAAQAAG